MAPRLVPLVDEEVPPEPGVENVAPEVGSLGQDVHVLVRRPGGRDPPDQLEPRVHQVPPECPRILFLLPVLTRLHLEGGEGRKDVLVGEPETPTPALL